MKVLIKNFEVEMDLKNNGVEFEVYDHDKHLGDVILTKTSVIIFGPRSLRAATFVPKRHALKILDRSVYPACTSLG